MTHTATPWHVNDDGDVMAIHKGETTCVATTFTHQSIGRMNSEQDAAFIVRSCNAHEDLVRALQESNGILEAFATQSITARQQLEINRAALAKATHE